MKKLIILLLLSASVQSQVSIGSVTPRGALDIVSSTQGLVVPIVALTGANVQNPIVNPQGSSIVNGTVVYNTASVSGTNGVIPSLYTWNGSRWIINAGVTPVNATSTPLANVYEYSGVVAVPAGSGLVNINISALGFTSILNVQISAERTTTDIRFIPLVSMTASPTTTNVSVAIVESNTLAGAGQGLELSTGACNVHITIRGIK